MKTTIELSDAVMSELKEYARKKKTTMRELVEAALRHYLTEERTEQSSYLFENHTFRGNGVCEGVEEGDWEQLRNTIYEGRGG
ncbi:MAG: ribbon-helix-helix protein, CopG family [Spirochaetaceae bacterium]